MRHHLRLTLAGYDTRAKGNFHEVRHYRSPVLALPGVSSMVVKTCMRHSCEGEYRTCKFVVPSPFGAVRVTRPGALGCPSKRQSELRFQVYFQHNSRVSPIVSAGEQAKQQVKIDETDGRSAVKCRYIYSFRGHRIPRSLALWVGKLLGVLRHCKHNHHTGRAKQQTA